MISGARKVGLSWWPFGPFTPVGSGETEQQPYASEGERLSAVRSALNRAMPSLSVSQRVLAREISFASSVSEVSDILYRSRGVLPYGLLDELEAAILLRARPVPSPGVTLPGGARLAEPTPWMAWNFMQPMTETPSADTGAEDPKDPGEQERPSLLPRGLPDLDYIKWLLYLLGALVALKVVDTVLPRE